MLVVKAAKPSTVAEQLIQPAAKVMVGQKARKYLNLVALSNDNVEKQINKISDNIKKTVD
jgi:hypothetical protein